MRDHERKEKALYFNISTELFPPAFWTRDFVLSFYSGPHKLCNQFCSQEHY